MDIKIRAWHEKCGMRYPREPYFHSTGFKIAGFFCDVLDPQKDFNQWKFMLCTGSKDRKGTEIYADDLLHYLSDDRIFQVVWGKDYTMFEVHGKEGYLYPLSRSRTQEIIVVGNIYENPELKLK